MRNRFLTLSAVAALLPTLAIAQQRPTTPPANQPRPAATPTTPAQRPAARPATPPAQQPRPAAARPMMGGQREGAIEWEVGAGVAAFAQAITGTGKTEMGLGGLLGIGYVINQSWSIGAGVGGGLANAQNGATSTSTAYINP